MSDPPATPGTACPECGKLRAVLDEALQQIACLQAELHELRCQLNRNSSNSSSPPSADPPGAPKPVGKTKSGRKPGGQPGHPGAHRLRLPPERVQTIVPSVPTTCARCQALLPEPPAAGDPEPTWHQVAELPPLAAIVTEHQAHARTCPCCGHLNREEIPAAVRAHVIGPRLAAVMSYLTGRHHLSRRAVEELVETVFEVPIALGTVIALEAETTAAWAGASQEVQQEVRGAAVKNTDETGWSEAGQKRWLWMAATATAALFVIHLRRSFAGLTALLGEMISGVVCSDRWSAYSKLPLERRQICWAHTIRTQSTIRAGPRRFLGSTSLPIPRPSGPLPAGA